MPTDRIATARPPDPPAWALDWVGYLGQMMGRYRPPRRNSRLTATACIDYWHAQHAEIVRQAVAAGLPVPAYVLDDYPEINRNPQPQETNHARNRNTEAHESQAAHCPRQPGHKGPAQVDPARLPHERRRTVATG